MATSAQKFSCGATHNLGRLMKTNILLTSGRAPATLELARRFHKSGYRVYVADSVSYSVSRFSQAVAKHIMLPSPRVNDDLYLDALSKIVRRYGIDLLVPTCEELFYIARKLHSLDFPCQILVDKFDKLDRLHDKYRFMELAESCGFRTPHTRKAETREELAQILSGWEKRGAVVIKPVYSRFGAHVAVLSDRRSDIPFARIENPPWVVQQYVDGDQYCTYSVCHDGKILAHVTYTTPYTLAPYPSYRGVYRGPGVYFISARDEEIEQWVQRFVTLTQFTGQIAFDFVRQRDGALFPIECNPRLTSGIHLFPNEATLCRAFTSAHHQTITVPAGTRRMVAHGVWLLSLSHLRSWRDLCTFVTDWLGARDVIFSWHDPLPFFHGFWITFYLGLKSWKRRTYFADTVTHDISWNGNACDSLVERVG